MTQITQIKEGIHLLFLKIPIRIVCVIRESDSYRICGKKKAYFFAQKTFNKAATDDADRTDRKKGSTYFL